MKKENIYIDLSKCTEEQIKHIFSLLPDEEVGGDYAVFGPFKILYMIDALGIKRWIVGTNADGKLELTYPEFINLLDGGEGESKPIELNISKEDFVFNCDASRQNLNGRENEQEIFLAGIESVIEELGIKFNSNQ